jgi:molybdopterin-guanine dinucleotide biosynthesis protein A
MDSTSIAGIILAGGRSSRMVGRTKACEPFAGRPLLRHVIDRIRPQVGALALSVETSKAEFNTFGLDQLPDPAPGHNGPLGGLLSAMRCFAGSHAWVLVAPCDAPFLPLSLAVTLQGRAFESGAPCAVAAYAGELQPTFSIWQCSLEASLERAIGQDGLSGFKQFMRTIPVARHDWPPAEPPPFFNINDHAALEQASNWLLPADERALTCSA